MLRYIHHLSSKDLGLQVRNQRDDMRVDKTAASSSLWCCIACRPP